MSLKEMSFFDHPYPCPQMISAYLPSVLGLGSAGKATLTSIGVPSQLGAVLRVPGPASLLVSVPHWRCCPTTLQESAVPNTLVIVACAAGATTSDPSTTDNNTSFRMTSPVPEAMERVPRHARVLRDALDEEYFSACRPGRRRGRARSAPRLRAAGRGRRTPGGDSRPLR